MYGVVCIYTHTCMIWNKHQSCETVVRSDVWKFLDCLFFVSPDKASGPPGLSVCCLVTHSCSPSSYTDCGTYFITRYINPYSYILLSVSDFHFVPVNSLCYTSCLEWFVFIFLTGLKSLHLFIPPCYSNSVHSLVSFTKLLCQKGVVAECRPITRPGSTCGGTPCLHAPQSSSSTGPAHSA